MLRNYIITAFRSLMKNKAFSLINIFGLIFSMAICLLVITIVINVNKSDDFHEYKERIYRVHSLYSDKYSQNEEFATSPIPLLNKLKTDFPQIEKGVQLQKLNGTASIDSRELNFQGYYSNPDFFETFSFNLNYGDINSLNEPFTVFITEKFSEKLFSDEDPIGQSIYINNLGLFEIKGIIKNPTQSSHLRFELIASSSTLVSLEKQDKIYKSSEKWSYIWENASYILVKPETNISELEANINKLAQENYNVEDESSISFKLQELTSLSPGKLVNNEIGTTIPIAALIGLTFIAVLILSITGFNYLNLSLAKSISKSKEIGLRKVIGSGRKHIIFQYITESVVILIISFFISTILFEYIFKLLIRFEPSLNSELDLVRSNTVYFVFFIFTILIGVIFGLITSLNISKSSPLKVLKDAGNAKMITRFALRKILITAQFIISSTFIIVTILVFKQFTSVINKDLGFNKHNLIAINLQGVNYDVLANEITNVKNVSGISSSYLLPISFSQMITEAILPNSTDTSLINIFNINHNFCDVLDIDIVAGRNYTLNDGIGSERYVLVNEKATTKMGFNNPSEAVGQTITLEDNIVEIIGVTKDFYYTDPIQELEALVLRYRSDQLRFLIVKYNEKANVNNLIADLQMRWENIDPNTSFSYELYEESLKRMFKPLTFAGIITGLLSILAISISCLGLLGMVAYNSESSKKEIGIRKVMGATPGIIIKHLSKSYSIIVSIAIGISLIIVGIGTTIMKQHLPDSIGFDFTSVLIGIGIIISITIVTILSQTYKAARRNPMDALRYE
ncbi:ABC transporter permease [Bacteroidota bacterium]